MARAHTGYLCVGAAITTCTLFLRAVRWRILLNAEAQLGVGPVFRANMVGYLGNNFLPARAGEVLRSLMISRISELTNAYVLTTALSERLMDVIAVVLAASLALLGVRPKPEWLANLSRSMTVASCAGALAVAVLPHTGTLINKLIACLPLPERLRQALLHIGDEVLLGLRAFHSWGRLAGFASLTALVWMGDGIGVMMVARSLDLVIPLPVAIILLTAMALGSALPSTPGYVGIYQFAAVMVLGPFGIGRDQALAYSFISQALGYIVVAALGVPALLASRMSLRGDVVTAAQNEA